MTAPLRHARARLSLGLAICLVAGCATKSANRRAGTGQAPSNLSQAVAQNAEHTAGVVVIRNEATSHVDARLPVGLTFSPFVAKKAATSDFVQDPFLQQFLPSTVAEAGQPQPAGNRIAGKQPTPAPAKLRRADVLRTALKRDQREQLRPVRTRDQALQDARSKIRAASQALAAGEFNRAYTTAIDAERILEESAIALSPDEQSPTDLIQEIRRRMSERSDQDLSGDTAVPGRNPVEPLAIDRETADWRRLPVPEVELLMPPAAARAGSAGVPHRTTAPLEQYSSATRQHGPPSASVGATNAGAVQRRPATAPSVASVQAGFTAADNAHSGLSNASGVATRPQISHKSPAPGISVDFEDRRDAGQHEPVRSRIPKWDAVARDPQSDDPQSGDPQSGDPQTDASGQIAPVPIVLPSVRFAPIARRNGRPPLSAQLGVGFLGILLACSGLMRLVFRRTAC